MFLIDNVADAPGGRIHIDMYHRGHLSLRMGTEVTLSLLPPSTRKGELSGMKEIVISPIEFESWEYLIRVTARFRDRPGLVRKLADAMQAMRLNIVYEESATVENFLFHRVEILAHTQDLLKHQNAGADSGTLLSTDLPILPSIERRLQAICLNDLMLQDGLPRLKVRPMEGLRTAHRLASQRGKFSVPRFMRTTIGPKGCLTIPPEILDSLQTKSPRVILVSDTRDRLLRALVPSDDMGFTFVRVRHRDYIGSLHRISDAISNGFTAIVTLTRLRKQREKNDIELLVRSHQFPKISQKADREAAISHLLASSDLANLEIEIAYPNKPGNHVKVDDWKKPERRHLVIERPHYSVESESDLMTLGTQAILAKRTESYEAETIDEQIRMRDRREAALNLANLEGILPVKPQVFVSYRFARSHLFGKVKVAFDADAQFSIVDGKNASGPDPIRDVIRDRIRASQGVFSVWPKKGPLDWLLWELGVAQAFRLPTAILIHDKLDLSTHLRLMPEIQFAQFNERNLEAVAAQTWAWFRTKVRDEYERQLTRRLRHSN